jgi:ParB-like chromosome segregation protein Spo0J
MVTQQTIPQQAYIDITQIARNPQNYKRHPREQIERIAASYRRFGQRKPLVVQKKNEQVTLVAGEGGLSALRVLAQEDAEKWSQAWVTLVPEDWTDDDILGYLVADNETQRGAESNEEFLADILERQQAGGFEYKSLGFNDIDYQALMKDRLPVLPATHDQEATEQVEQKPSDLDQFNFGTIRQLVFQYDVETYQKVIAQLDQYREQWGLETNSDVLIELLHTAVEA